jgi:hypothetical protein
MVDVKKALLNPSTEFKQPDEVVRSKQLTRDQKIEILRRWEYDIRELQVADEESMTAPRPEPVTLDLILNALRALGAAADTERSAPTKQGGS